MKFFPFVLFFGVVVVFHMDIVQRPNEFGSNLDLDRKKLSKFTFFTEKAKSKIRLTQEL